MLDTQTRPILKPLNTGYLADIARVHMNAFGDSAISKVGLGAVKRYYHWQLTGPHDAVALGIWVDDELAGFCFAGIFRGALGGFVRRNRMYLAGQVLMRPWLLFSPLFRDRLALGWNTLWKRQPARTPSTPSPRERSFGVLSLAVDPQFSGQGLGRKLMEEIETRALERGFKVMDLVVHPDNAPAVALYLKLNWEKIEENGQWTGKMCKHLL